MNGNFTRKVYQQVKKGFECSWQVMSILSLADFTRINQIEYYRRAITETVEEAIVSPFTVGFNAGL